MVGEAEVSAGIKSSSLGGAGVKFGDRLHENRWQWKEKLCVGLKENQCSSYELQRRKREEDIHENDTQQLGQQVFFLGPNDTKMGTVSLI